MKIKKLLNNNAVVIASSNGQEQIVTGKGIGFKKAIGDDVDISLVEKTFMLSSHLLQQRFQEIVNEVPLEYINLVEEIVSLIHEKLHKKLSDVIYLTLTDHLYFALENHKNNIHVTNDLMFDITRFYPHEFTLGMESLSLIKQATEQSLPIDEAGLIALHIVNAEIDGPQETHQVLQITKLIESILGLINDYYRVQLDEESLTYFKLINHLRYFAKRVINNEEFPSDKNDTAILIALSNNYHKAYSCSQHIKEFILDNYNVYVGSEELLYLTLHIQHAFQSN